MHISLGLTSFTRPQSHKGRRPHRGAAASISKHEHSGAEWEGYGLGVAATASNHLPARMMLGAEGPRVRLTNVLQTFGEHAKRPRSELAEVVLNACMRAALLASRGSRRVRIASLKKRAGFKAVTGWW